MKAAYNTLRDHARERQITFAIDYQQFAKFARLSNYLNLRGIHGHCLTVDRRDNTQGYLASNIQPMTRSQNSVKRAKYDQRRMAAGFSWRQAA